MEPTPDTPQERDDKAEVLADATKASEDRYVKAAALVAKEMRFLRIEQRAFYGVTLLAFAVSVALIA